MSCNRMLFANKSPSCSRRVQGRRHCPGVRCKKKRRIVKLNTNQILSSRSLESSAARKEVWEIFSFILHRGAHNSVLLLDSLHGRNSQTQLAPSRLLKSRGFFLFFLVEKKGASTAEEGRGVDRFIRNTKDWRFHLSAFQLDLFSAFPGKRFP